MVVDHISKERRSWLMSQVKQKNTGPEIRVRKTTYKLGIRYRLHSSQLPGKPDLVVGSRKTVIFVHGCFWHRHRGCKKSSDPKTRLEYWGNKFRENVQRDQSNYRKLRRIGWRSVVIWECQTKDLEKLSSIIERKLLGRSGCSR